MQHDEESPSEYESFHRDGDRMDEDAIMANRILMGSFSHSFSTTAHDDCEAQVHELEALVDTLKDQVKKLDLEESTLESDLETCEIAILESRCRTAAPTASPTIQLSMPPTTITEPPVESPQPTNEPSLGENIPEPSQDSNCCGSNHSANSVTNQNTDTTRY